MDSLTATSPTTLEPIPGYRLKHRIGEGGFGEVWAAEAPGGLVKAVKLVHSHADEKQSAAELEALNRIKQVRHPFLLSLERIELVQGRLIIVTELAESSLKDRFNRCRAAGQPGIPRDELLGYLKDAAEALDYIREFYSLQHLDIKPENLLLIGGRVKLADFGLVSDLQESSSRLVAGLTPMYAAPELFAGRPSAGSDQYSLAIVFMEMLTGVTPFKGRTSAQLAAQHLESPPDLSVLSPADRALLARAMSKDPVQRFERCKELIDRLSWVTQGSETVVASGAGSDWPPLELSADSNAAEEADVNEARTVFLADEARQWRAPAAPAQFDDEAAVIVDLPGGDVVEGPAPFRPTLYIGLGGAGARVLGLIRERLKERYGGLERVPSVGMLLVDTAPNKEISASGLIDLSARQVLVTALRPSGGYRNTAAGGLKSTERRWTFNVPRSRSTEGLRPLGRLALIDNLDQFTSRVRMFLTEIMSAEAIGVTAARVGQPAGSTAPRVFLIAALGGGTGSGMFVEAAYAVRNVISRLGLPSQEVYGVLCYSTDRRSTSDDLTIANACAGLREWRHFSDSNQHFPGEPECGLPPAVRGQAPFDETYLVHLGDKLTGGEYRTAIDHVAEYLFRSALTDSAAFFDRCRVSRRASVAGPPRLSTFGMMPVGKVSSAVIQSATDWLCRTLPCVWRGDHIEWLSDYNADEGAAAVVTALSSSDLQNLAGNLAGELTQRLDIDLERVLKQFKDRLTETLGVDTDAFLAAALQSALFNRVGQSVANSPPLAIVLDAIDHILGAQKGAEAVVDQNTVQYALSRTSQEIQDAWLGEIGKWAAQLVDAQRGRMRTGRAALRCIVEKLVEIEQALAEAMRLPQEEMRKLENQAVTNQDARWVQVRGRGPLLGRKETGLQVHAQLNRYFRLRLETLALCEATRLAILVRSKIEAMSQQIGLLQAELDAWVEQQENGDDSPGGVARPVDIAAVSLALETAPKDLLAQVEAELEREFIGGAHIVPRLLTMPLDCRRLLPPALRQASRAVVLRICQELVSADNPFQRHETSISSKAPNAWVAALTPKLLQTCGGQRRMLVIKSDDGVHAKLAEELARHVAVPPAVLVEPEGQSTVCCEVDQIDPVRVARALTGNRREFNELASRLQSRADIAWTDLA